MSGFVRFVGGDWAWSSSMTRLLFDYLADSLPEGVNKSEVVELRDNNVLILDLRDSSRDLVVTTIIEGLPEYLRNMDPALQPSIQPGFTPCISAASPQSDNRTACTV